MRKKEKKNEYGNYIYDDNTQYDLLSTNVQLLIVKKRSLQDLQSLRSRSKGELLVNRLRVQYCKCNYF